MRLGAKKGAASVELTAPGVILEGLLFANEFSCHAVNMSVSVDFNVVEFDMDDITLCKITHDCLGVSPGCPMPVL